MTSGPPTKFSKELCDEICERMKHGESLNQICKSEHMPSRSTVIYWADHNPDFAEQYTRARQDLVEYWADDIVDIADDGSRDWTTKTGRDGEEYDVVNHEVVNRSKLRVETRKWLMSQLAPKKYGPKQQNEHTLDQSIVAMLEVIKK